MLGRTNAGFDNNYRYSTDEQWTGKYWIDGKKIYQKVIALTTNTTIPANFAAIPFTMPQDITCLLKIEAIRYEDNTRVYGVINDIQIYKNEITDWGWTSRYQTFAINKIIIEYTK